MQTCSLSLSFSSKRLNTFEVYTLHMFLLLQNQLIRLREPTGCASACIVTTPLIPPTRFSCFHAPLQTFRCQLSRRLWVFSQGLHACHCSMWRAALLWCQLWAVAQPLLAEGSPTAVAPQDCSLECISQGGPACEYCRVTKDDINKALGFNSIQAFGGCIPWPCFQLLGAEDPQICQHYVHAPTDVKVEFVHDPNPNSDTIVIYWKPSRYGISFLRGFQVSLQALGGFGVSCQLLLFHRNVSLSASGAQTNSSKNQTFHSYQLSGLEEGTNYTCEIAANEIDAVRKTFKVHIGDLNAPMSSEAPPHTPAVSVALPLCLAVVLVIGVILAAIVYWKTKEHRKKLHLKPELFMLHENRTKEEVVSLPKTPLIPPRLLICYSRYDGPAHVKAIMHLGTFVQQHMATQVHLDLWENLSLSEEGSMSWHCRKIQECDFVLVICSPGLRQRHNPAGSAKDEEGDEVADLGLNFKSCEAVVHIIGEEVGRAKARGQDLSKYMTAIFEYCEETDIPTELRLVSCYRLTSDLPLLFSHLHGVALHRPGSYLKINHITEEGFSTVPSGAALQWAIREAGTATKAKRAAHREGIRPNPWNV
ncbi:interleukin-17 receptor D isoform X2 [Nothobranchius furzeri]|uniref:Transcript variant X2 n=1 Tax=Nothobranchius furzeri TaxID=105023 RepID=A0A9D2XY04_NOTFU|nr:transcript variant X2 [Nothobranchius furzeri]